jgi:adenine-specific DNA-methyltransferase
MTLNYIGSKKSLLSFLDYVLVKVNKRFNIETKYIKFLDGFAGTGIVSKYFNEKYGYKTFSNDLEYYSFIISYSNLKVLFTDKLNNIINELNKLSEPISPNYNLLTNNYSPKGKEKRMFFTEQNTKKADAIIEKINDLYNQSILSNDEKIFIISSLVVSLDKVANTASVYEAYLKEFKKSALQLFELKPIHTNTEINNFENNMAYNFDINNETILNQEWSIVYLDPPYNERQYSSNYNLLNFVSKYDSNLEIYGKAGLIRNYNKSKFCSKTFAEKEFQAIIDKIKAKYILVSYNNEGIISQDKFIGILKTKGRVTLYKKEYKRFKSNDNNGSNTVYEYLYLVSVGKKGKYREKNID